MVIRNGLLFLLMVLLGLLLPALSFADDKPVAHPRILMLVTSQDQLPDTGKKTGVWFEELTTPYYVLKDAGYDVDIFSMNGGIPPVDPRSEVHPPKSVERFREDKAAMEQFNNTKPIDDIRPEQYAALFLPGGHGVMWDMVGEGRVTSLIRQFTNADKPIAAVCHAPAELLDLKQKDNTTPFVKGRRMTGFTRAEEKKAGLENVVPVFVDKSLADAGAKVITAAPFTPNAVRDGKLITGQNPASAEKAAKLLIAALRG